VLTSPEEVNRLSAEQAESGLPVRFQAVCTYFDIFSRSMVVQRERDAVFVDVPSDGLSAETARAGLITAGMEVQVEGVTSVGESSNVVVASSVKALGTGTRPPVERLTLGEKASGPRSYTWVELEGIVRSTELSNRTTGASNPGQANLVIATLGGEVQASIPSSVISEHTTLIDSRVKVRGAVRTVLDSSGSLVRIQLLVPGKDDVTIVEDGPLDPFSLPVARIADVLKEDTKAAARHRVHAQGVVAELADGGFSLRDETGEVRLVDSGQLLAGDRIEAVGFPTAAKDGTVLEGTTVREVSRAGASERAPSSSALPPVLRTVATLRALKASEAARQYPVQIRGVLTFLTKEWRFGFVQDETGGVFVQLPTATPDSPLLPGQILEVQGRSGEGDFAPIISRGEPRIVGPGAFPVPARASIDDLFTGHYDSAWVEAEGIVHAVTDGGGHPVLQMSSGSRFFRALLWPHKDPDLASRLIDAKVHIRGVCGSVFNERRQLTGIQIFVPREDQIAVVEPPPSDPFQLPVRPIRSLMQYRPDESPGHRVHVLGTVTYQEPDGSLYVRDETGPLYMRAVEGARFAVGSRIDAVGFTNVGDFAPLLEDVIVRPRQQGPSPSPLFVTAEEALTGQYHAQLVVLEGRLLERGSRAAEQVLTLKAGRNTFSATVPNSSGSEALKGLQPGSLVRLTGICLVQVDRSGRGTATIPSFRVLTRGADDVQIVRSPSWWNRGRILGALLLVTAVLVLSWLWVAILQRTIRRQTTAIQMRLAREAALEERYRELFESASDIVLTLDLEGRITSLNRAGRNLFGLSANEAVGRSFPALVVPEHEDQARRLITSRPSDDATVCELDVPAPDGSFRTIEVRARVMSEEGRVSGIEGIARDITERKQAEEQIVNFATQLEQRNAELQSFTDVASHDLQEPLRKVRAFAEKLDAKWENLSRVEISDLHRRMASAAERMQSLITQLLAYARLGKIEPQLADVNMAVIGAEVLEDLEARIEQTGGRVELEALPRVRADATQLRQLLQNLIGNALKFARPGERPHVRVSCRPMAAVNSTGEQRCEIAVTDNGIGFDQSEADRIFQAFYRLHTRQQYEGTGLGLAICQKIVQRHGGVIRAVSTPGVGTAIIFTMALVEVPKEEPAAVGD
jgi:PAS domain S-box-containing protein